MTDTTDIKALRAGLTEQIDHMECYGGKGWVSQEDIRSILNALDQLEAERQRAADLVLHVNTQANMREKAEEEIAALKCEQVPVAWQSVSTSRCNRMVTLHKEMAEDWERKGFTVVPLFTAPQKPVVLPAEFYSAVQNNDGMFELSENCMCAISSAIAGGSVKDGE